MSDLKVTACSLSVFLAAIAGHAPCGAAVLVEKELVAGAPLNQLNAFGLPHTAAGNAQLSMSPTGALVVSNIGSSGLDGVTFPIGDVRGYSMSIDFRDMGALMPGGLVEVFYPYAFGDQMIYVEYPGDGADGRIGKGPCPSDGRVRPTSYTVSILDDGEVVGRRDILCGETDHLVAGDIGTDPVTGEGVSFRFEQDGWGYVNTISLPVDTLLTIPGTALSPQAVSVVGDQVRVRVHGLPPASVPSGPVRVLASNIGGDLTVSSGALLLPGTFNRDDDPARSFVWTQSSAAVFMSGQVTGGGMPEAQACQSHPKSWFFPRGTLAPTRAIQVANIGSSGSDWVKVRFGIVTPCGPGMVLCPDGNCVADPADCSIAPGQDRVLFVGGKDPAAPDYLDISGGGQSIMLTGLGSVGGNSSAGLGTAQLVDVPGANAVDLIADFTALGSEGYRAEVYLDGVFVGGHDEFQNAGRVMGRLGNHPTVCEFIGGGALAGDALTSPGFFFKTFDIFTYTGGGLSLVGNEVRILATSAPSGVDYIGELWLTGDNLDPFDFRLESQVDDPAFDVALGTRAKGLGTSVAISSDSQTLIVANIGSSGDDGVVIDTEDASGSSLGFASGGEFTVDSFFDISYSLYDEDCSTCEPIRLAGVRLTATTPDVVAISGDGLDPTALVKVVLRDGAGGKVGSFTMEQNESVVLIKIEGDANLSKADSKRALDPGGSTTLVTQVLHFVSGPAGGGGSGMDALSPSGVSYQGVASIELGVSLATAVIPPRNGHVTILKSHDPGGTSGLSGDMVFSSMSKKGYDNYVQKSDMGVPRLSAQGGNTGGPGGLGEDLDRWFAVTNIGSSGLDGVSMDLSAEACRAACGDCDDDCDSDIDSVFLRFESMSPGNTRCDLKVKVVAKQTPIIGGGTGGDVNALATILQGPGGPELSVTVSDNGGSVYVYSRAVSLFDENGVLLGTHTYNPGETDIQRMVVFGAGDLDGRYQWDFVDEPNPGTGRIRRRPDLLSAEWDAPIEAELTGTGQFFAGVKRCEVQILPAQNTVFDFDELVGMDLSWTAAQGDRDSYLITEEGISRQPSCPADTNGDGVIDNGDIGVFITLFLAQDPAVDFTGDGVVDNGDIGAFIVAFLAGC